MANCTKNTRTFSIFRPDGKWNYKVLAHVWDKNLKKTKPLSIRTLAALYGEKESTLRYHLQLGITGGKCGYYVKTEKKWSYHYFSAELATQNVKARAANKGPVGRVTTSFVQLFMQLISDYPSVTYALQVMHEERLLDYIPSRSAVYRHLKNGSIKSNVGHWTFYQHYHKQKPSNEEPRPPKNHTPKHMIDDLPQEALKHTEPGHYQMDTVVSCQGGSGGTLVVYDPYRDGKRRAFVRKLGNLKRRTIRCALRSIVTEIHHLGYDLKTILTDNGNEFLETEKLEAITGVPIYYCHPYRSCEKGAVERLNRLIRRFYPKGTNFKYVTQTDIRILQERLIRYPRTQRKAA